MFTIETVEDLQKDWRDQYAQWWYAGMPSFEAGDVMPLKQLHIRFHTMEDRQHFANLFGYKLTERTNAVSYPVRERENNMMMRYIEVSDSK